MQMPGDSPQGPDFELFERRAGEALSSPIGHLRSQLALGVARVISTQDPAEVAWHINRCESFSHSPHSLAREIPAHTQTAWMPVIEGLNEAALVDAVRDRRSQEEAPEPPESHLSPHLLAMAGRLAAAEYVQGMTELGALDALRIARALPSGQIDDISSDLTTETIRVVGRSSGGASDDLEYGPPGDGTDDTYHMWYDPDAQGVRTDIPVVPGNACPALPRLPEFTRFVARVDEALGRPGEF